MQFEDFSFSDAAAPAASVAPGASQGRLQYLLDNTPSIIYCTVPSGDPPR